LVKVEDAIAGSIALSRTLMELFQEVVEQREILETFDISLGDLGLFLVVGMSGSVAMAPCAASLMFASDCGFRAGEEPRARLRALRALASIFGRRFRGIGASTSQIWFALVGGFSDSL
jgi:hypothetical protein